MLQHGVKNKCDSNYKAIIRPLLLNKFKTQLSSISVFQKMVKNSRSLLSNIRANDNQMFVFIRFFKPF